MWPFSRTTPTNLDAEQRESRELLRIAETQLVEVETLLGLGRQKILSGSLSTGRFPASDANTRQKMIERATKAFFWKPLGFQPIQLTIEYALGQGGLGSPKVVSWGEDMAEAELISQQEHLDVFWTDPWVQRAFSSYEAQVGNAAKLLYEGELWASIFGDKIEPPTKFTVRILDCYDVLDPVVTLPNDDMIEVAYWINQRQGDENVLDIRIVASAGTAKEVLVRSADYERLVSTVDLTPETMRFCQKLAQRTDKRWWIQHALIGADPTEHRGWPYTARAMDWVESNENVVDNMIQHIRSILAIAWHKKVVGSKEQLAGMTGRLTNIVRKLKAVPLVGSEYISNDKVTLEPIDTPTGGAQVSDAAAKLTAYQVGAATQWPYHTLMGDPSTGNLATAKSLELPTLKHCRWFQGVYGGFYESVCDFVLRMRFKERAGRVEISFPEITERDVQSEGSIIIAAAAGAVLPIEDDPETGKLGAQTYLRRLLEKHV